MVSELMNGVKNLRVDVLVVGGGPVGLITTYALVKEGIKVMNIEQYNKQEQGKYGRACLLYPRSIELLEQMGLYDEIREVGFVVRGAITYRDGEAVESRGWTSLQPAMAGKTSYDFCLGVRQRMSEEAFRNAIKAADTDTLHAPARLLDFHINEALEYPVSAKIDFNGTIHEVQSKFIIGADGGRSAVRSLQNIPFPGSQAGKKWVRLDAVVKTNMPDSRSKGIAIESQTHGNVLWIPTDHGRTRIGFVWRDDLPSDVETIIAEAKKAVFPFTLDIIELDWWTTYSIGQHVAERFRNGRVFLAGDAGHTHSSGAAQGMNTGVHDSSNLGWKLAGVLKGWYTDAVLDTYSEERKTSAEQLIQIDRDVAACISGVVPAHFNAPPDADPNQYFDQVLTTNVEFTIGLGITYQENLINSHNSSAPNLSVKVGHRAPDPGVFQHGEPYPRRLHSLLPNRAKFWILVFAGGLDPDSEQPVLRTSSIQRFAALRDYLDSPSSFANTLVPAFNFITVIRGEKIYQSSETLGTLPLGKVVHDRSGEAYNLFGVDEREGALVVLRPDGVVGFFAGIDQYEAIGDYFSRFVSPAGRSAVKKEHSDVRSKEQGPPSGEISIEGQLEETKLK